MPRTRLIAFIFCLLTGLAHASPFSPLALSPGEQCRVAIVAAERGHAVPPQLLASIGRVESGRRDPGTGAWGAWPWTINAEGQGSYFETKAAAIQAVMALQARGVRSIDVGCMQVNLMYHPDAFASLDMAFEPSINADYAARFLVELHGQTGDWTKATANYHSANPWEGGPYADKVTSIWPEEQRKAGLAPSASSAPGRVGPFANSVPLMKGGQSPRLFAMAGTQPIMMPPGMTPPAMMPQSIATATPPQGMGQGMGQGMMMAQGGRTQTMGSGQGAAMPARGLDFYRSAPVSLSMAIRPIIRSSNRITMR